MKNKLALAAAMVAVFVVVDQMQDILSMTGAYKELYRQYSFYVPETLKSLLQMVLVLVAVCLLKRVGAPGGLRELGLLGPPQIGFVFALIAVLPMFIVFGFSSPLAKSFVVPEVFYLTVLSPLAEEVVYRGFAFGGLRRLAGWGFWPAALLPAAIFGWGHAAGSDNFGMGAAIFLLTGVGALLFSWVYERWGFNLWVPFFLHFAMNLAWNVFEVGESAFAGWLPTTLQVTTVVLAILLTIHGAKRFGRVAEVGVAAESGRTRA